MILNHHRIVGVPAAYKGGLHYQVPRMTAEEKQRIMERDIHEAQELFNKLSYDQKEKIVSDYLEELTAKVNRGK